MLYLKALVSKVHMVAIADHIADGIGIRLICH